MTSTNFCDNFKRIYQMVVVQIWPFNLEKLFFQENNDQATKLVN